MTGKSAHCDGLHRADLRAATEPGRDDREKDNYLDGGAYMVNMPLRSAAAMTGKSCPQRTSPPRLTSRYGARPR